MSELLRWEGDLIAGGIQTENWSAEFEATRENLLLKGPRNLRYEVPASKVVEVRVGIGQFMFFSWQLKKTIRIVHSETGVPDVLAFRSRKVHAKVILRELASLGFVVGTFKEN